MTVRANMGKVNMSMNGVFKSINMETLPMEMDCEIFVDLGDNSNTSRAQKLSQMGDLVLPKLNENGQGMVIKEDAPAVLATQLVESMGLDPSDYFEDYTTEEFKQRAQQAAQEQTQKQQERMALEDRKMAADAALAEANVEFTGAQTKNTADDNAKQLAVSIDKHFQEWADLQIKSVKEGAELPPRPDYAQILLMAQQLLNSTNTNGGPNG